VFGIDISTERLDIGTLAATQKKDMVRHETKWGEKKESVAGSVVSNRPAPAHVLDKS